MRQQAMALPASYGAGTTDQAPSHGTWFRQLKLAAQPSAVPWARRLLRQLLCEWQLERMSDTAMILVSELITNAVQASGDRPRRGRPPVRRPMIALSVRLTDTSLIMEVWDANPARPVRPEADLTGDCGRGLSIIEVLGDNWGHYAADGGKVVWCEVAFSG